MIESESFFSKIKGSIEDSNSSEYIHYWAFTTLGVKNWNRWRHLFGTRPKFSGSSFSGNYLFYTKYGRNANQEHEFVGVNFSYADLSTARFVATLVRNGDF